MHGCNSLLSFLEPLASPLASRLDSFSRELGIAVFCLGALQTLALLFRPKTTHKFRKYWKSYHHFVGYGCVVLGFVNVFQGLEVIGASRSYAKLCYY
ncbi:hypothetical protein L6164_029030 [Bauhinia variegata]|uniref:Uncharacterized protein n=1 Tax=Bauhinia variegata TaxID=167791 RepID=A0ACB9L7Z3_BAUVA|nr:hypothetical protein L6164_029030 [Bauhinia variegata]